MKNLLILTVLLGSLTTFAQTLSLDTGETYAVVVGISDYQDEGIPDLRFADKDALAFAGFLQSPAGGSLDEDHLKVLINEEATVAQFAVALDWLMEVVKENDKVLLYFSGHGDVERKTITQPGYLLCWDAPSRVYLAGGALALPMFQDIISTLSAQNKAKVVVITDACRSGKLSGSSIGGTQITGANLAKVTANEIKILSCQADEYSIEGEQWGGGRGAFSYHLLDGLYGMADGNADLNVSLKELGRYLEDNVTEQVAPEKQNPVILGDKSEKLTDVFPDILNELKEGRRGQMQLFKPTETKGIEEDVLASVDPITQKIYSAFKRALKEKQFLEPVDACADAYYEILIKEPKMERLHSSMRRNYAAALQDDAQQVLNIMLKSGLTEDVLANVNVSLVYKNYPNYLERAAALLGKDHYMFNILHARKYFFEGRIKEYRKERRPLYRKAMELQPNMAHAMVEMIRSSEANQLDSVNYYFKKATELVPSWEEPYLAMSSFYQFRMKDIENAEELLNLAGQVDSNSVLVWFKKGRFYYKQKNYQLAEKWLLKTIQSTGDDICFPCAHNVLGFVYWGMEQDEEAMHHFKKAIKSDSINLGKNKSFCRPCAYINIGAFYSNFENRYDEAEQYFLKALKIDSTIVVAYVNLGVVSEKKNKLDLAEQYFLKALELNPSDELGFINLIGLYVKAKRYNDADQLCKRTLELNPSYINGYNVLGLAYKENQQYEKAIHPFEQVLQLDSTFWWAYANLGEIYQNMKRWEEMATVVEKAIEYAPPTGILFNMLGNAYNHIPGRLKEVKNMLEKSLELSPELPSTYIYLAQWYLKNDQKEDAWSFLNQGLDKGYDEYEYLQSESDFEVLRKTPEWNELMQKYFPEQDKK